MDGNLKARVTERWENQLTRGGDYISVRREDAVEILSILRTDENIQPLITKLTEYAYKAQLLAQLSDSTTGNALRKFSTAFVEAGHILQTRISVYVAWAGLQDIDTGGAPVSYHLTAEGAMQACQAIEAATPGGGRTLAWVAQDGGSYRSYCGDYGAHLEPVVR